MMDWLLIVAGTVMGLLGMTVAVSAGVVHRIELYRWITNRMSGAQAARHLLGSPDRVVGSALALVSAGTVLAGLGLRSTLQGVPAWLLVVLLILVGVPVLGSVVFALPRAVGRRWGEAIVRRTVPVLMPLARVFAPMAPRRSSVRPQADGMRHVESGLSLELSDSQELSLVSGVLAFTERPVREVMTPRTEIVAVPESASLEDIGRAFATSGFSRIPVYHDSLDHIVGMFYAFDLHKLAPGAQLMMRPIATAPTSKPCADLLFELQRERRQLAVILDEYGGTAGIASLQDLLEELVDETFEPTVGARLNGPPSDILEVQGTASALSVGEHFGVTFPRDVETIGGLLSRSAGRIPIVGERYELAGLEFDILAATATRVERVAVRRGPTPVVRLSLGGENR